MVLCRTPAKNIIEHWLQKILVMPLPQLQAAQGTMLDEIDQDAAIEYIIGINHELARSLNNAKKKWRRIGRIPSSIAQNAVCGPRASIISSDEVGHQMDGCHKRHGRCQGAEISLDELLRNLNICLPESFA